MTDLITEARELCEGATSGQWKRHDTADYAEIHNGDTWGKNLNPIALVGHTDDANFIARSRTLIPELVDALEKAEAANAWIPVTERLPKTEKPVQVYMPKLYMSVQTGFYTKYYGEDDGEWYEHWVASGDVTHWRPLPAPPEEGAEHERD